MIFITSQAEYAKLYVDATNRKLLKDYRISIAFRQEIAECKAKGCLTHLGYSITVKDMNNNACIRALERIIKERGYDPAKVLIVKTKNK